MLPLIDAVTGAPGMAFPRIQLRSGIANGRKQMPCTKSGILSENLPQTHVFIAAFHKKKCSIKSRKCQSRKEKQWKKPCHKAKTSGYNTGCVKNGVM
jgi:hypothetical protein